MHDLILRNRVHGYREGDLHRHVHSAARPPYEHYLPGATSVLVAYPIEGLADARYADSHAPAARRCLRPDAHPRP